MALTHGQFFTTPDTTKTKADRFTHDPKKNWQANVEYTDKIIGKLIKGLETHGVRDKTLVMFIGDNGTGGKDFTDSKDPEVAAARNLMARILADKPVPTAGKEEKKANPKRNRKAGKKAVL